jgi:hypothetical protein
VAGTEAARLTHLIFPWRVAGTEAARHAGIVGGFFGGKGSFMGRYYLMEDLPSLVLVYRVLYIVNCFYQPVFI